MKTALSRRELIQAMPGLGLAAGALLGLPAGMAWANPRPDTTASSAPGASATLPWPDFPRQNAELVQEVVGKSHRDEARVRELVKAHPALVNVWWDWGFGDWESPLGAASHVGLPGIAEFLLENGARPDIFAAAMLGWTDVVEAFVVARPGIQRSLGPHGITLLKHAEAGGERAAATLDYLKGLGDADVGLPVIPLPEDRKPSYVGTFVSQETGVSLETRLNSNGQLVVEIQSAGVKPSTPALRYVGEDEFFPSGVPSVRFNFAVEEGKAVSVAIRAAEPILTATRVGI